MARGAKIQVYVRNSTYGTTSLASGRPSKRRRLRAGRGEDEVTLVAVTKAHPPEALRAALAAGLRDLGENRIEELEGKVGLLGRDAATWHMVGHVQSRKARQAVECADLIHSVDTVKLARKIFGLRHGEGHPGSGSGAGEPVREKRRRADSSQDEAVEAIHEVLELPGVEVRGLMTMAPFVDDEKILRRTFRRPPKNP